MKTFLCTCFLFSFLFVFSQTRTSPPVVTSPQTFGYVDGTRIDSLNAEYATFEWGAERLFFDYGQSQTRKKTTVTDENGDPLMFARHSKAFTLNFLYFNKWQLNKAYYNLSEKNEVFIMKKLHDH